MFPLENPKRRKKYLEKTALRDEKPQVMVSVTDDEIQKALDCPAS